MLATISPRLLITSFLLLFAASGFCQARVKRDSTKAILSYNNDGGDLGAIKLFLREPVVTTDTCDFTIPFSRAGNLILIAARADTTQGSFILDTGAPGLILNTTYFRDYPTADPIPGEEGGGITGAVAGFGRTTIRKLAFGAVNYYNVEADRISLGHIENSKGIKIFGLLGVQLFMKFEMIIDYEASEIHLHHVTKKDVKDYKHTLLADTATYSSYTIELLDNKIITYGKIGKKKLTFLVDTGAESNVLDSRLSEAVLGNVVIKRRTVLNGTGNSKIDALYGDMSNLSMGTRDIATMPVLVTNMEKMCFSYQRCLDGMLGFDFLSMQKIGFNFVKRKMYIWK
ncbi:MAG: aspartyl protease family protein [Ferruginibacter sp.]|nr:aspartyl protease family protein [Ferruginibacter sp.]